MSESQYSYNYGYKLPGRGFTRDRVVGDDQAAVLEFQPLKVCLASLQTLVERADKYHTVLGVDPADPENGNLYGPFYLDLDDKEHPEHALEEVRKVSAVLERFFPGRVVYYFSGCKGFHIEVDADVLGIEPSPDLNLFYHFIAKDLATALQLDTIDLGIYDRVRLWRVPNTWNSKGERYKIPLGVSGLALDFDVISEAAKRTAPHPPACDDPLTEQEEEKIRDFLSRGRAAFEAEQASKTTSYDPERITGLPDGIIIPCIQRLEGEEIAEGDGRNRALYVLGCFYYHQKMTQEAVGAHLTAINQMYHPPLSDSDVTTIVESVFRNPHSVGCRTPELSSLCPGRSQCFYFCRYKPTDESQRAGLVIADTPTGFTATAGDWEFTLSNLRHGGGKVMCLINAKGPNGFSKVSSINLLSQPSRQKLLARCGDDQGPIYLDAVAQYIYEREQQRMAERTTTPIDTSSSRLREEDGRYWSRRVRGETVEWVPVTNFTLEVMRILHVMDYAGETNCVREIVLTSMLGQKSRARRAEKADLSSRVKFNEWLIGAGDFNFCGNEQDLHCLCENFIFGANVQDEAMILDHVGHVMPERGVTDTFLWGNVGVHHGNLIYPDASGAFTFNGHRVQLRGIDIQDQWAEKPRGVPKANLEFLDNPEGLRDLKRNILDLMRANLIDYRGWLALGMVYASLYLPEVVEKYSQFPGLYIVGPMGSGKNTIIRWLQGAMGMIKSLAVNLPNATLAALDRWSAYYSGFPLIMDEFRNSEKMDQKVHLLRDWYDRVGRAIATKESSSTVSRPVRGWSIIAGQDTSLDAAFVSRFITLVIQNKTRSSDQYLKASIDSIMEKASAIPVDILRHKNEDTKHEFLDTIIRGQDFFMRHLTGIAHERMAFNYAVAVAGFEQAFGDTVSVEEMQKFIAWTLNQTEVRNQEQAHNSEAATFLQDLAVMISCGMLREGDHYRFEQNINLSQGGFVYNGLFLWVRGIQPIWADFRRRQGQGVWSADGIMYALENEDAFVAKDIPKYMGTTQSGAATHRVVLLDIDRVKYLTPQEVGAGRNVTKGA